MELFGLRSHDEQHQNTEQSAALEGEG